MRGGPCVVGSGTHCSTANPSSSTPRRSADASRCGRTHGHARMANVTVRDALLVLADGSTFEGEAIGADVPVASGEVVFNTVLSGYQEVVTDPSYGGQIITFTYPHIGNYGVN